MQNPIEHMLQEFRTPFDDAVLVFSVMLLVILLAPILMSRFRIPGIIGLIVSGVVIGPHALDLIAQNSAVKLFSTIGLLYIMFIAGLELDLGEFSKNRYKSLVFGVLTFVLPIALGLPACLYLLDYEFKTSLLTASMFATHTLIAYPIVSRLGISKTEAVAITVGGTILTDTAVLILLAVISGAERGGLTVALWTQLGVSILLFILLVVFVIPRIAAWFFKRMEDEKNAHFIFVLAVVFFCAFAGRLAGLEPIVGAFAAGLALNRLIPHASALMNRLEFVGNALFIPFFLVSVGMLVDVSILAKGPQALYVAATLTVVALLGKWAAAFTTSAIFGYSVAQRQLIFGLSSAHAAATLAVILVGYNLGIIDDNILNGTIILIMVTCLVASFVTEEAGRKAVLETEPIVASQHFLTTQRILVPISNPDTMERLIDFARSIREPKSESLLTALTVVNDDDEAQPRLLQARQSLEKAIQHAAAADLSIDITATIDQNVANGIKRVIRERFITDVVMGWPGKTNLSTLIFGTTFDSVVTQTAQQVFITRFMSPLNVHQRMLVFCPVWAEMEHGFSGWVNRLSNMASSLSMNVHVFSTAATFAQVKLKLNARKVSFGFVHESCEDLSVGRPWFRKVQSGDVVVLIAARKGSISYLPYLDSLPEKMTRNLSHTSLIFVYPEISAADPFSSYTQVGAGGILEKGWDILKGAKGRLRKR